jgi:hypothetical protein
MIGAKFSHGLTARRRGSRLPHTEILGQLLKAPGVQGNLVPDAHLAALAMEHGLILFHGRRFRQILWIALAEPISRLKLSMRSIPSVRLGSGVCVECSASLVQATGCAPKRATTYKILHLDVVVLDGAAQEPRGDGLAVRGDIVGDGGSQGRV